MAVTRSRAFKKALLLAAATAALGAVPSDVTAQGWPPEIQNLQHFPEDMTAQEVIGKMRDITIGLGVRCTFCHVGEEGQPLASFDFASDDKVTKRKAREMLAMVEAINSEYLASLPERGTPRVEVTCATCHSGKSRPVSLEGELTHVRSEEGVDAAIARYRELREQTFGSYQYNFVASTLTNVAQAWAAEDWNGDAIAILELNTEFYPDNPTTYFFLGQLHMQEGRNDEAIANFEKTLEINPNFSPAQRFLDQLRGGG